MAKGIHTEETLEALIEAHLTGHGYQKASPADYHRTRAMLPQVVLDYVQQSQPQTWSDLRKLHSEKLDTLFLDALGKDLDQRGTLEILRHGFKFYGKTIQLAVFEPGHQLNPGLWQQFEQNRLSVVRQLRYDPGNENELDLVLFLNGLPIVTVELKNAFTQQSAEHAKAQYRQDRDPKAPIFRWNDKATRSLVHFAVDADVAWMTTRLEGPSTYFLPFNRGQNLGAGNPAVPGKHRTYYLWEEVWERRSLLDLVGRFLHYQSEGKKKLRLLFPRYHQLDAVRKLVGAAAHAGPGHNYLIQHSAGSGKSNSIAWLAYRLSNLHDSQNQRVYHAVIVLTDRRVLDQQLQNTIYEFEHKAGLVEKIDKKSDQLAQALQSGTPIIISTIHKFGFISDKIQSLPDRNYAIIVDEAHSSQSGEMASHVKEILAHSQLFSRLEAVDEDNDTTDQLALRAALLRGPQANLSFFAFTATPKFKTLEVFGHKVNGQPAPFHLYSMRQAIEEGFILDVLRGYTTYSRFFKLNKAIAEDPSLDKRQAANALTRFVNLHPTNIAQKTEIVIEHFRACVMHLLNGQAKAMMVTGSRLQAARYKRAFDHYIAERGYHDVRCLVAFSGEVADDQMPGVRYAEVDMNEGIKESELPDQFASPHYQVLIVANKYQTGFDQPRLCAMYVDKRLAGIQAVQTLSRLNRTYRGKETTFVLDFVNNTDEILAAFQAYYESTTTAESVDPQNLYSLRYELIEYRLWSESELDGFASVFFKLPVDKELADHAKLNAWIDPAVDRFRHLGQEGDERKQLQEDVRGKLVAFRNLYAFLGQIVPFQDADLEKLYAYARFLLRKLPRLEGGERWEPGEDVVLASLKLRKQSEADLGLVAGQEGSLTGPTATGTGQAKVVKEKLSAIIAVLNDKYGLNLPDHVENLLDGVQNELASQPDIQQAARSNDKDNFKHIFEPAVKDALLDHHVDNGEFINKLFADEKLLKTLCELMMNRVYGRLAPAPLPFRRIPFEQVRPFVNCVPAFDLKVAAGNFSAFQEDPGHYDWVELPAPLKAAPGLFVAQVVGESMNRRIPNGAWCLWSAQAGGSRQGKVVLAQLRDQFDPDTGGHFTVKIYSSSKKPGEDGEWVHQTITLSPDSNLPEYRPIEIQGDSGVQIVAQLVQVLGG